MTCHHDAIKSKMIWVVIFILPSTSAKSIKNPCSPVASMMWIWVVIYESTCLYYICINKWMPEQKGILRKPVTIVVLIENEANIE